MARRKKSRSPNGQGLFPAISVTFDLSDPDEFRAFEMAQQLATPHGRRKHAIISFLLAIYDLQIQTGQEFNADTMSAQFITERLLSMSSTQLPSSPVQLIAIRNDSRTSMEETAKNLLNSIGNVF